MAKKPSKKQLAARKKFAAMARKRAKQNKTGFIAPVARFAAKYAAGKMLKKKAGIGDTLVRIPSNTRKTKRVTLQRNTAGRFDVLSGDMYNVRTKLESEIKGTLNKIEWTKAALRDKTSGAITKVARTKFKKYLVNLKKALASLKKQLAAQNRLINSNLK